MANEADLKLIQIPEFPKTDTLVGSGPEYVVLTKADGVTYGMLTEDFKAFLGTVQVLTPAPLSPSDPVPTIARIYLPTEDGIYPEGITVDRSEGGADYQKSVQLIFDGTEWFKYTEDLPQPENKIIPWTAAIYPAGQQVLHDGQFYVAPNGATPADEPSLESAVWNKLTVYILGGSGPGIFSIADANNLSVIHIDEDGLVYCTLAEYSIPSTVARQFGTDKLSWAITGGDKENPIILLGKYPDGSWVDPELEAAVQMAKNPPVIPDIAPPVLKTFQNHTQASGISTDGIHNQWIEPIMVTDWEGNVWFCSIGSQRILWINKMFPDGRIIKRRLSQIRGTSLLSDDHNSPAILLDQRPGAEYPIMIFQAEHNSHPMRFWKFNTLDLLEWQMTDGTTFDSELVGYTQVFRNNDEIFVFSRVAVEPQPWRIAYSPNNGVTWTSRIILSTPARWLYCLARLKSDGSGLNIAMHGHPLNSTNQDLYFLELNFASGALINPANRSTPLVADIRDAIANPSFVPINPFTEALVLYSAQNGELTRLWDVSREPTGNVSIVFNTMPSNANSMANFNASRYKVTEFKLIDGSIVHTTEIEEAGTPIENPKADNMYFAGACMIDYKRAIVLTWRNHSQIDGGTDTSIDYGKTTIKMIRFTNPNAIVKTVIAESDKKAIRPFVDIDREWVLLNEGEFETFNNFYTNTLVNRLDHLIK